MAPVIGPNFNAHSARTYRRPTGVEIPEDLTNVKDLEDWVGDDQDKARAVLTAEEAKGDDARSTLVASMQAIVNPAPAEPEGENSPETGEEGSEGQSTPEGEPEAESTPETAEETPEEVAVAIPDGMTKVKDLEGWVGDDAAKAQVVLDAEAAKPEAERRKTLISKMEGITASDGSDLI